MLDRFRRGSPARRPLPRPHASVPTRARGGFAARAALVLGLVALPAAAYADCGSCPPPSAAELAAQPGFAIQTRSAPPPFGRPVRDHVEMDGGECRATIDGAITVEKTNAWLALRATGEVWNCPHSSSDDKVVIEVRNGDSSGWSLNGAVSAEAQVLVASVKAQIAAGQTTGASVVEVTRVEKTIRAKMCNRIPWKGYFEIATYVARAPIRIERRWAWWTKNASTGARVHAKGSVWVYCGTEEMVLDRQAPISGVFHLRRKACSDPECKSFPPEDLGWFPRPQGDDDDEAGAAPNGSTPQAEDQAVDPLLPEAPLEELDDDARGADGDVLFDQAALDAMDDRAMADDDAHREGDAGRTPTTDTSLRN